MTAPTAAELAAILHEQRALPLFTCGDAADGIDWADLLPRTEYAGTFLVEYEPLGDTADGIRRSLDHLRAVGFDVRLAGPHAAAATGSRVNGSAVHGSAVHGSAVHGSGA